jgi:hypothetical protein
MVIMTESVIISIRGYIIKLITAVINFVMKQASDFVVVGPFLQALTNMLAFYDTELIMAVKNYDTRFSTTLHLTRIEVGWS